MGNKRAQGVLSCWRLDGFRLPLSVVLCACAVIAQGTAGPPLYAQDTISAASGIEVPDGFQVQLYADDDLAHDIHSLTVDSLGRVVVSGPGYVRILIDQDGDGVADSYKQFAELPRTGSQGMFWLGRNLLCSGDDGLLLFRDENRDDRADGLPQPFLRIAAGGEHHVHSIQKGPDGWWYVIAGNFAGVNSAYATLPTSPLKDPENGVLFRLKPDLSGGEIVCDGMRNAYDFAFTASGDIFTFDSDDERDVSLPWYLPTRVFHLLPRSHAGWVSAGWKRPQSFADMPPVTASFGRGSPTGVACYRHRRFPEEYRGALFVLDWTLGRIHALPLQEDGSGWKSEPISFASGRNQFGFAPTDIEPGADGSLYVSVGGRGTRGSVYRISYGPDPRPIITETATDTDDTEKDRLDRVLTADQPLSSWSRAQWMPAAEQMGAAVFRQAALDETRADSERVRAIEILVESFGGVDQPTASQLINSQSTLVRARTAWATGRSLPDAPSVPIINALLGDSSTLVQRFALESLVTVHVSANLDPYLPMLAQALRSSDRYVRLSAASLMQGLSPKQRERMQELCADNDRALVWLNLGFQLRASAVSLSSAELATGVIADTANPIELRREAARLLQLSLGDVGPADGRVAMFDSYLSATSLASVDLQLNPLRTQLAAVFPSGDEPLDYELIRVIAMTTPLNRELMGRVMSGLTEHSAPADDIHRLAALAQFPLERSYEESRATAAALVNIDVRIRQLGLNQDTNWDDRMGELFAALCRVDPAMPQLIAEQPGFGQPAHTLYMSQVPQSMVQKAIDGFVTTLESDDQFRWTNDVVFVIGESSNPAHDVLLRQQLDNLSVRDAVLMVLAEKPRREDRSLFVSGLESTQLNAVEACVTALTKLPRSNDPSEQFQLLSTARRLVTDEREFRIRETIVRLLQNNTGQSGNFVFGENGYRLQPDAMRQWQEILTQRYPSYRPISQGDAERQTYKVLGEVQWAAGDAERGRKLFEKLSCAKCHGGRRSLGPDLTGVTRRFGRDDLFASIIEPNRDISPRYQTTSIATTTGKVFTGLIVYESIDGLLLRDAEHKTYRIEGHEIESRHAQRVSLMPSGLLKDVDARSMADLYRYLQEL